MHRRLKLSIEKDLLLVNGLSLLQIFAVAFFPDTPIRTLIGVPLVLFFPGYTIVCALFPKKKDLDGVEKVALSIGLSLAVVPLLGLVLNYTAWGIRLYPVLFLLFLFTLSMSIATAYRRKTLPAEKKFVSSISINMPKWREMSRANMIMLVGFVAFVVAAGSITAYFVSMPRIGEQFTEFYIVGPEGKIADYPVNLTLGENGTIIIGIVNHEYQEVTYKISVKLDNETLAAIDGVKLKNEEAWQQNFTFAPQKIGEHMKIEFLLYTDLKNVEEPYRSLQLFVNVRQQE